MSSSIDNKKEWKFWLNGEGAGTWFIFSIEPGLPPHHYRIRRVNPEGETECDNIFEDRSQAFLPHVDFEITYISHCQKITIQQKEKIYILHKKQEYNG